MFLAVRLGLRIRPIGGGYFCGPQSRAVPMIEPLKVVLFVDGQNTYRGAREIFFGRERQPAVSGQYDPVKLGELIAARGGPGGASGTLSEVRVYTGRPDPEKDPRTYAAHMRQCSSWARRGVNVIARPLRYPPRWPDLKAEEKGIDVAIAVDLVGLAVDAAYEIGVVMSTDTDLLPAIEFVRSRYAGTRYVATAAWRGAGGNRRLSIPGANIWCH